MDFNSGRLFRPYWEEVHTLNSLAPRNMSCQITCFGAQGDKVSRLVSQKAKTKCGWKKASLHI